MSNLWLRRGACEINSNHRGRLHLFEKVIQIHVCDPILGCMPIRIPFTLVTLDLQPRRYSLLTEGNFIPSATPDNKNRREVKLVIMDNLAHKTNQLQRGRMVSMPQFHHMVLVSVITDHVNINGVFNCF